MGYGSRALSLLHDYYCGHITSLSEGVAASMATPTTHIDKVKEIPTCLHFTCHTHTPHSSHTQGEGLMEETIVPRADLPPLLCSLANRPPDAVDYVGVAYGLTLPLYRSALLSLGDLRIMSSFHVRFWSRAGYVPVYLRQTPVSMPYCLV